MWAKYAVALATLYIHCCIIGVVVPHLLTNKNDYLCLPSKTQDLGYIILCGAMHPSTAGGYT